MTTFITTVYTLGKTCFEKRICCKKNVLVWLNFISYHFNTKFDNPLFSPRKSLRMPQLEKLNAQSIVRECGMLFLKKQLFLVLSSWTGKYKYTSLPGIDFRFDISFRIDFFKFKKFFTRFLLYERTISAKFFFSENSIQNHYPYSYLADYCLSFRERKRGELFQDDRYVLKKIHT